LGCKVRKEVEKVRKKFSKVKTRMKEWRVEKGGGIYNKNPQGHVPTIQWLFPGVIIRYLGQGPLVVTSELMHHLAFLGSTMVGTPGGGGHT
jgi:hypothetical protein